MITDEQASVLKQFPILFSERLLARDRAQLVGSDDSGSLQARLQADLPLDRLSFSFHFVPSKAATPKQLSEVVEFVDALIPGRRLGIWMTEQERWGAHPVEIPAEWPGLPEGYAGTVRALATLQEATGVDFVMPSSVTDEEAEVLHQALQLLSGGSIEGTWSKAELTADESGIDIIRSAAREHGALFEFAREYTVTIFARSLALGMAQYRLFQVKLAGDPAPSEYASDLHIVTLLPGGNDRFDVHLLNPPLHANTEESEVAEPVRDASERRTKRRLAFAAIGASTTGRGAREADEMLGEGFGRD